MFQSFRFFYFYFFSGKQKLLQIWHRDIEITIFWLSGNNLGICEWQYNLPLNYSALYISLQSLTDLQQESKKWRRIEATQVSIRILAFLSVTKVTTIWLHICVSFMSVFMSSQAARVTLGTQLMFILMVACGPYILHIYIDSYCLVYTWHDCTVDLKSWHTLLKWQVSVM